ncbi:unnamed protein product [Prorocentrum cordatum]|uniref:Uncharacterized protein n=1 Tax=Prorocentrum cordatum TaxID=2364126 RepID=A0ABN9Q4W4_9DINO|nr:unnamed protein product [Polarella glacialis]
MEARRAGPPRARAWRPGGARPRGSALPALERLGRGSTATRRWAVGDGAALKLEEIGGHALRRDIRDSHRRRLWREGAARDEDLEHASSGAAIRGLRRRLLAAKAGPEQRARWSSANNAALGAALAAERRDAIAGDEVPQAFADVAAESDSEDARYSRALIPDLAAALPPPLTTKEVQWSSGHGYAALAGASILCTDGSAMRGKAGSPEVRAGWGLTALQTRGADGILDLRTDRKLLVTGFAAGRAWCCAWDHPYLEVRREFWQAVDDFGGQLSVRVSKMKGHATARSVRDGHTTMDDYEGNRAADGFAKTGAELHPTCEAAARRIKLADAIAVATVRWLGEALQMGSAAFTAADGADAGVAEPTCCGHGCGRRGAARCRDGGTHGGLARERDALALQHMRWPFGQRARPRWTTWAAGNGAEAQGADGAGAAAAGAVAAAVLAAQARGGAQHDGSDADESGEAAGAEAAGDCPRWWNVHFDESHHLWAIGEGQRRLVFCAVCGCYADGARVVSLRGRCAGGASARQETALRRMRQGRHPTRGGAGAELGGGRSEPLSRPRSRSRGRGSEARGPSR